MRIKCKGALFWISFFLVNFLIFLPGYYFQQVTSTFFPWEVFNFQNFPHNLYLLFYRTNSDIFRVSGELCLILLGTLFINRDPSILNGLIKGSYFLLLLMCIYATYQGFSYGIYGEPPHLSGDLYLLPQTFDLLAYETSWQKSILFAGTGLLTLALIIVSFRVWKKFFVTALHVLNARPGKNFLYFISGVAGIITLFNIYQLKENAANQLYFSSVRWPLGSFIKDVWVANNQQEKIKSLNPVKIRKTYPIQSDTFPEKPDIFLFFVESYGKILATSPEYRYNYQNLLDSLQAQLNKGGWHAVSNYSIAPVSGGRSWLSFTSVTNGIQMDNHAQYQELLHKFTEYPHLLKFLKQKGYTNYKLNPLHHSGKEVPVTFYKKYYAIDHWLQHQDFSYSGDSYGWVGIPDQYTLQYFHHNYLKKTGNASMVFFLTLSGHTPWIDIPPLKENWQSFNKQGPYSNKQGKRSIFQLPEKAKYPKAMAYQLKLFVQYIQKNADKNSIILLIGDHQPPGITPPGSSFETPVHIIGKDNNFINRFLEYGFVEGLWVPPHHKKTIRHEGIYSMFKKELLRKYGNNPEEIPDYLPEGLK